jgi:hypothetical protein
VPPPKSNKDSSVTATSLIVSDVFSPNSDYYQSLEKLLPDQEDRARALRVSRRLIKAWDQGQQTRGTVPAPRLQRVTRAAQRLDDPKELLKEVEGKDRLLCDRVIRTGSL